MGQAAKTRTDQVLRRRRPHNTISGLDRQGHGIDYTMAGVETSIAFAWYFAGHPEDVLYLEHLV